MLTSTETIGPIQQTTLADVVCERIRRAIITGQLKPGERLSEPSLAAQLGVSRSPVREALQRLQMEGLVDGQTNRSATVWKPSEEDVKEIFSLRVMIETLAAEWCINQLTEDDFKEIERIIALERQAIQDQDYLALISEDKHFHEYFCLRSGHRRLLDWWQQIIGQWEVLIYRRLAANPELVVPSIIPDHLALLEAMKSRDINRVINLHREVNERVEKTTAAVLTK